jgi:hypothetical protein
METSNKIEALLPRSSQKQIWYKNKLKLLEWILSFYQLLLQVLKDVENIFLKKSIVLYKYRMLFLTNKERICVLNLRQLWYFINNWEFPKGETNLDCRSNFIMLELIMKECSRIGAFFNLFKIQVSTRNHCIV